MSRSLARTVVALCLFSTAAVAQNVDLESLTGIRFNFANPGARSLGMGGAFLALADDSSAAEANPAGLTGLTKRTVSVELRSHQTTQQLPATTFSLADLGSVPYSTQTHRTNDVTFASVIVPVGNLTFAGYYHEPLVQRNAFSYQTNDQLTFYGKLTPTATPTFVTGNQCIAIVTTPGRGNDCAAIFVAPYQGNLDINVRTYGVATGIKFGNLSIGGAARYEKLSESTLVSRAGLDTGAAGVGVIGGLTRTQESRDHDLTFSLGLQWLGADDRWGVGGVYKQGPKFSTTVTSVVSGGTPSAINADFHVPNVLGGGVFVRPIAPLTLTFDAVNVKYSNQADAFHSFTLANGNTLFASRNATELHVGGEWAIRHIGNAFYIRAGAWRDPAHGIFYNGPVNASDAPGIFVNEVSAAILYPRPRSVNHLAGGVGLQVAKVEIDAAYDHASHGGGSTGSLSLGTRF